MIKTPVTLEYKEATFNQPYYADTALKKSKFEILHFKVNGDERGSLIALEKNNNIPFDVRRVYYIFGTKPGVTRGKHAHKELKQVLVCINGSCKILLDNGTQKTNFLLDRPDIGLYINGLIWREMYDFSSGSVLMALTDNYYIEDDYIRDYEEFFKLAKVINH